jgi:flagellar biosynthesis protein FlhG
MTRSSPQTRNGEPVATLISVASGKGGVGKSVVSSNLALALAKTGRSVVLADLDVGGADAHILFGQLNPPVTLTDFLTKRVSRLDDVALPVTFHPTLRLIAGTGETLATANMPYARKKRLMTHFQHLDADVVVIDIGAGTNYHALDFFLMADVHLTVTTPEPTAVLDLYRFIKLAAIRRVLASVLARSPMSEVLSNRDFASVEAVMDVAGATDAEGRDAAAAALRSFRPGLIINRTSGRSAVNVLYLRKILQDYVGGDLTLLGEIPEDPAVQESVRNFLPVIEAAPASSAAKSLLAVSAVAEHLITACIKKSTVGRESGADTEAGSPPAPTDVALHVFTTPSWKPSAPSSGCDANAPACVETASNAGEIVT